MTYQTFISKEELNTLPVMESTIPYVVIEDLDKCLQAVKELSAHKVLGFDTETRPSFTKGEVYQVSMLQLGSLEKTYLFRLNKFALPVELTNILSDESVVKTGVAIHDDVKGLQKLRTFVPRGFVDIAKVVEKKGFKSLGLRALAGIFLGKRLSKAAKTTNWERLHLTPQQLAYAAMDAEVGLKIYLKMKEGEFGL